MSTLTLTYSVVGLALGAMTALTHRSYTLGMVVMGAAAVVIVASVGHLVGVIE